MYKKRKQQFNKMNYYYKANLSESEKKNEQKR